MSGEANTKEKRSDKERRHHRGYEYPFIDGEGNLIIEDRRIQPDRRAKAQSSPTNTR